MNCHIEECKKPVISKINVTFRSDESKEFLYCEEHTADAVMTLSREKLVYSIIEKRDVINRVYNQDMIDELYGRDREKIEEFIDSHSIDDLSLCKKENENHSFECDCCGSDIIYDSQFIMFDELNYNTVCKYCAENFGDIDNLWECE